MDELRARSRFATRGRDRQRTGDHRAQRAPQQGSEEKNSTALRYHVCRVSALCPARNFRSKLEPDDGLCAHMDERTCIRVITVDVTSSVQAENKCSAVAMWMVRHKQSQQKKKKKNKAEEAATEALAKAAAQVAATAKAKKKGKRQQQQQRSFQAGGKEQGSREEAKQKQKHSKGKRGSIKAATKAASKQQQK